MQKRRRRRSFEWALALAAVTLVLGCSRPLASLTRPASDGLGCEVDVLALAAAQAADLPEPPLVPAPAAGDAVSDDENDDEPGDEPGEDAAREVIPQPIEPAPEQPHADPAMWFLVESGKMVSLSRADALARIEAGSLTSEMLVLPVAGGHWQPVGEVAGLKPVVLERESERRIEEVCKAPRDSGSAEPEWWWRDARGQVTGPFTCPQLVRASQDGLLGPTSVVKRAAPPGTSAANEPFRQAQTDPVLRGAFRGATALTTGSRASPRKSVNGCRQECEKLGADCRDARTGSIALALPWGVGLGVAAAIPFVVLAVVVPGAGCGSLPCDVAGAVVAGNRKKKPKKCDLILARCFEGCPR